MFTTTYFSYTGPAMPSPTPTPSITPTNTPTPTPSSTVTPTPTPTPTITPSPKPKCTAPTVSWLGDYHFNIVRQTPPTMGYTVTAVNNQTGQVRTFTYPTTYINFDASGSQGGFAWTTAAGYQQSNIVNF